MQESGLAPHALLAAGQSGRPLQAAGDRAEPDPLGTVLPLVLGDLVRTWTKQTRKREARLSTPLGDGPQRTNEESVCKY